ncbi:MAG: RdgB/HAM1 family non-canonical purine NTP pyrophosphatase [Candidatus Zixiibacteriota bacterium]
MRLALATNNPDKISELRALLSDLPVSIVCKDDIADFPEVPETAATLKGNAALKARAIRLATGLPALADDTGLEVSALDMAPGVRSARYAGEEATYSDNTRKLLQELADVPEKRRTARFRCVIALDWGDCVETAEGDVMGLIALECKGSGGFGYDSVFFYPPSGKTFAEMSSDEKNAISHRSRALKKARKLILRRLEQETPSGSESSSGSG